MTTASSTGSTYIHGNTDAREVARLEKQASFVWRRMVGPLFIARPGERVLDLATGVGAMAARLRAQHPDVKLTGVDLRLSQLRSARANHPEIPYVNADGAVLPFRDATFERVHCSWLLEHVSAPTQLAILREVRRVLKPGGTCHFIEVDNSTFRTVPPNPLIQETMDALNAAQVRGGGDPYVGQKLPQLFESAGFRDARFVPSVLQGTHADPEFYRESVEEFAEIFESIDEAVDPEMARKAQQAAQQLRAQLQQPGTEMHYAGVMAIATR